MAEKRGVYRARRKKTIRRLEGTRRRVPNSLREIFNAIRETADNGEPTNHAQFLSLLQASWTTPDYGVTELKPSIFRTTEDGRHPLYYYQIEAYARQLGVPSALILALSRAQAELGEDPQGRSALSIISGLRAALANCESSIRETGELDLRDAIDAFRAETEAHALNSQP